MKYEISTMLSLLTAYDISIGFKNLKLDAIQSYVYPPAILFPEDSLLKETINYFSYQRQNPTDRRVGFLISSADGRLLAMVIELTEVKPAVIEQLKQMINTEKLSDTDMVLNYKPALMLFRQLYTKVRCVLLGLDPADKSDKIIARQQLGKRLLIAYAAEISVNFIKPPVQFESSSIIFLDDLITVFKKSIFTSAAIDAEIMAKRDETDIQLASLVNTHTQQVCTALKKPIEIMMAEINSAETANPDFVELLRNILICFKRITLMTWRQSLEVKMLIEGQEYENLLKLDHDRKQQAYAISACTSEHVTAILSVMDINQLLSILSVQPSKLPKFLLPIVTALKDRTLKELSEWQDNIQAKAVLQRRLWKTGVSKAKYFAEIAYYSSLAPVSSLLVLVIGNITDDYLFEKLWYQKLINFFRILLQKSVHFLVYIMTLSESLSTRLSELAVRPSNGALALQVGGGLLGCYITYLMGLLALLRTMLLIRIVQRTYQYGHTRIADDKTATLSNVKFSADMNLMVISRCVGSLMALFELGIFGDTQQLLVYLGGFVGSALAHFYSYSEKVVQTDEGKMISFLTAMGGFQIGQAIMGLFLAFHTLMNNRIDQRQQLVFEFHQLMHKKQISEVEVEFPSLLTNPSLWLRNSDSAKVGYRNLTSGFFHRVTCELPLNAPTICHTLKQTMEPLKITQLK